MWFYPDGFKPDYGIDTPRKQSGLEFLTQAKHLFYAADPYLQAQFPLKALLQTEDFTKVMNALQGRPTPTFDPASEAGEDTLDITQQVTPKNFYTSGTKVEPILDVLGDVSDRDHYKLVSVVLRPGEPEEDVHFSEAQDIPQIRLVYQLMSPRFPDRPYEQLFLHLNFDAVDRLLPEPQRREASAAFLRKRSAVPPGCMPAPARPRSITASASPNTARARPP